MWSLADVLDRAARLHETSLGSALAPLQVLARRLPAGLTRRIYLECWLGADWPRVDLIVKIEPHEREALADAAAMEVELGDRPTWQSVEAFARVWAEPGSPLGRDVRAMWLEFDLAPGSSAEAALRAPRVFVDFQREAQCRPIEARLALALDAARALSGASVDQESLRACLAHLPAGCTLPYLGVFVREGGLALRVCLLGLGAGMTAYLRAVGWPGDIETLARWVVVPLARTQRETGDAFSLLHLDLTPSVGARIGLEYPFSRPGRAGALRSEAAFLDELVRRGWCTVAGREVIRRWPGRSVELLPHDVWQSSIERQVGHVKITFAAGEGILAKAYLSLGFDLIAGGTLVGGRPRFHGARSPDGAPSPSDGAMAPVSRMRVVVDGVMAPSRTTTMVAPSKPPDRAGDLPRALSGTAIASSRVELVGGIRMTMSSAQQEVLEKILSRAGEDLAFRRALLVDPRTAIREAFGIRIPPDFRVKFIERDANVDALIVLPDAVMPDGELSERDLEAVAGGAEDPSDLW